MTREELMAGISDLEFMVIAEIVEQHTSAFGHRIGGSIRMKFREWRDSNGLKCEWCHASRYQRDEAGNPIHNPRCIRGLTI